MRIASIIAGISLTLSATTSAGPPDKMDFDALERAGLETAHRLLTEPVRWEISNTVAGGTVFHVSVVRSGKMRKLSISVEDGAERPVIFRLIERDGLWFVTDSNGNAKYRPHEAPTDSTVFYLLLQRSEPVVADVEFLRKTKLESANAHTATFRGGLEPEMVRQMKATIAQSETLRQTGREFPRQMQDQLDWMAAKVALINHSARQCHCYDRHFELNEDVLNFFKA